MSSKLKKLGSLADIYQSEHLDGTITKIRLDKIHPSSEQPRKDRLTGVDELAESIKKDGLLSPIVITRDGEGYRVIAGERRYHAVKKLGWQEVESRIISREERDYWRIAIIENLQRENLSASEEAAALLRLKVQENYSDAEISTLVGKSRNYITEILGIAGLKPEVLDECRQMGIDNKNILIQVVQAEKKGNLREFLDACRKGAITTIRSAKEFNQGQTKEQKGKPAPTASSNKIPQSGKTSANFHIETRGNELRIICASITQAKRLETWIKTEFKH